MDHTVSECPISVSTCQSTVSSDHFQHKSCQTIPKTPTPPDHPQHKPTKYLTSAPDSVSQIFIVLSSDALTTSFPFGENATEITSMKGVPVSVRMCQPMQVCPRVRTCRNKTNQRSHLCTGQIIGWTAPSVHIFQSTFS